MKIKKIHDLLIAECNCILRSNHCDRKCAECDLVQDEKELIQMYDIFINIINNVMRQYDELGVIDNAIKRND